MLQTCIFRSRMTEFGGFLHRFCGLQVRALLMVMQANPGFYQSCVREMKAEWMLTTRFREHEWSSQ